MEKKHFWDITDNFLINNPFHGLEFQLNHFCSQPVIAMVKNLSITKSSDASAGISEVNISFTWFLRL